MTRRQEIIEILSKEEKSAHELANYFKVEMPEILEDLNHIKYSIKPKKIVITPAKCKKCGFELFVGWKSPLLAVKWINSQQTLKNPQLAVVGFFIFAREVKSGSRANAQNAGQNGF